VKARKALPHATSATRRPLNVTAGLVIDPEPNDTRWDQLGATADDHLRNLSGSAPKEMNAVKRRKCWRMPMVAAVGHIQLSSPSQIFPERIF